MQLDSKLQKLEVHVIAIVAVALVAGSTFLLSGPFSAQDYDLSNTSSTTSQHSSRNSSGASEDVRPALLEPALRSLDGVAYHG